jgi:hypothetical protein
MGFNYSPKIVTDGLVMYLDAANSRSYVSGSTAWNDLSRNGNNGIFLPGSSSFNPSNNNAISTNCTSSLSFANSNNTSQVIWFYYNGTSIASVICGLTEGNYNSSGIGLFINNGANGSTAGNRVSIIYPGSAFNAIVPQAGTLTSNAWTQLVLIRDSTTTFLYQNAALVGSTSATPGAGTVRSSVFGGPSSIISNAGSIGSFQIYNRALTASEIQQNYNTHKTRFGLT